MTKKVLWLGFMASVLALAGYGFFWIQKQSQHELAEKEAALQALQQQQSNWEQEKQSFLEKIDAVNQLNTALSAQLVQVQAERDHLLPLQQKLFQLEKAYQHWQQKNQKQLALRQKKTAVDQAQLTQCLQQLNQDETEIQALNRRIRQLESR